MSVFENSIPMTLAHMRDFMAVLFHFEALIHKIDTFFTCKIESNIIGWTNKCDMISATMFVCFLCAPNGSAL